MMEEQTVKSWGDFLDLFSMPEGNSSKWKYPLFRGQANSQWKLQTTLERMGCLNFPIYQYYDMLRRLKTSLETFTGKSWILDDWECDGDSCVENGLNNLDYLVYLRHYGFPSPLLDWTRSPFISAFFCCSSELESDGAIIVCEFDRKHREFSLPSLNIMSVGPHIPGERRHFVQQAEYLWALDRRDDVNIFADTSEAFNEFSIGSIRKIIIPHSRKEFF
jgi:hypothetical protein